MNSGKIICDKLKAIRKAIAYANSIKYEPIICDNKEDCIGTCPQCDTELRYLTELIAQLKEEGKDVTIPEFMVNEVLTKDLGLEKKRPFRRGVVIL